VLPTLVFVAYFAAAALLMAGMRLGAESSLRIRIGGLAAGTIGVVLHGALLWKTLAGRSSFALNIEEAASLIGFGVALIALLTCAKLPRFAGTAAILLALCGLDGAATAEGTRVYVVAHGGWELNAHIALSILAYSLITFGTALAVALTLLDRRLRSRQPLGWYSILPPVDALESGMFTALAAGFAALSLALFSGFFFVEDIWAQSLSRKIALSCIAWGILAVLLFGRWRFGWRGRRVRNWTIYGFLFLGLAYFGSKIVLESILGRHWG
jgi:ABC-type uncharacterized transport system permease subunit